MYSAQITIEKYGASEYFSIQGNPNEYKITAGIPIWAVYHRNSTSERPKWTRIIEAGTRAEAIAGVIAKLTDGNIKD